MKKDFVICMLQARASITRNSLSFRMETYPEMKIKDAVRISMSVPLYFEAVFIDSAGQVLNNKNLSGHFDVMVDGGPTGNFPISIFDSLSKHRR